MLPRRVESPATIPGPRAVTALQPSYEGTVQMAVHPVSFGSLCVVNVESSVKSALRLSL